MAGDLPDLVAWGEAAALASEVVLACGRLRGAGATAAADQLARAAESIPSNIAEAYGRGFGKDGGRFLRVARGSATELESHLWIAGQTGRMPVEQAEELLGPIRISVCGPVTTPR
jgi:four helix bundle protein